MKRTIFILLIALVCCSVFAQSQHVPIKNVAVVETMIDEASGAAKNINRAEVREITNEIRSGAVRHLPRGRFNIMTTETVLSMGDAVLQECAEENCVIALGSKIGADYITRGTISKFQQTLTLTVEIFDTEYGMLLATAIIRTANLNEMLEKTSAACAAMYKDFMDGLAEVAQVKAARQAARQTEPPPPAPAPMVSPKPVAPQPAPAAATTYTPAPMPTPQRGSVSYDGKVDIEMVFVEGGTFTMGCTKEQGKDCGGDEKLSHTVTVSSFYIGKYEVTQKQWVLVMGSNPSTFKGDDLPVESVSWNDVQEFILRLNRITGRGYRLPTEAEWEYAARGGKQSQGYKYAGSNNLNNVAWYLSNSGNRTNPVGTKRANELGIFDMSGNVWEWVSDRYGGYTRRGDKTIPTGSTGGSSRVYRGGGWYHGAMNARVPFRDGIYPDYRSNFLGFRLVLVSP